MSLKTGDTIAGYGGRICASATPVLLLEVLPDLWIRAAVIPQPGSGRRAVAPTIDTWMPVGASKQNLTAPVSLLTNETSQYESQSANDAHAGASAGAVAPVPWTGCCSSATSPGLIAVTHDVGMWDHGTQCVFAQVLQQLCC